LIFDETVPPPSKSSPKEIDSHILRVILANQYNLKKGPELFCERANEAVMNDLSEIDGLKTYEPQRITDLTYKDKKRALESPILVSEKRANQDGHQKSRIDMWQLVTSNVSMMDMTHPIGHHRQSLQTVITNSLFFFSQVSLTPTKTERCLQ
jgi:hypothetical protein